MKSVLELILNTSTEFDKIQTQFQGYVKEITENLGAFFENDKGKTDGIAESLNRVVNVTEVQINLLTLIDELRAGVVSDVEANSKCLFIIEKYFDNVNSALAIVESIPVRALVCSPNIHVLEESSRALFYLKNKRNDKYFFDPDFYELYSCFDRLDEEKRQVEIEKEILFLSTLVEHHKTLLPFINNSKNKIKQAFLFSSSTLLCTLSEPQITALFSRLSAGRYIDLAVTLAEFSELLLGSEPMAKPIQWLKSNRALAYLLNTMYERKMINSGFWQSQVEKRGLFLKVKTKPFKAHDLAQAITAYQKEGNPTEASRIDLILEEVKTLKG